MNDTDLMLKLYIFIRAYWCQHKHGPSFREMSKNCDYASSHLGPILERMERIGMIKYPRHKRNAIRPVDINRDFSLREIANLLERTGSEQSQLEDDVQVQKPVERELLHKTSRPVKRTPSKPRTVNKPQAIMAVKILLVSLVATGISLGIAFIGGVELPFSSGLFSSEMSTALARLAWFQWIPLIFALIVGFIGSALLKRSKLV